MTNREIVERLKAVINQERAFYQHNENLRISDEEAAAKLATYTDMTVHIGLHLLGGQTKEYHELKTYAYGEDQITFEELGG